ncbi:MAG: tetratricopeptide repeat protein [Muribaculaceae bacterium]|nr:tetratricopeptide repeat protein [Muribaculaceae bacterium]
MLNKILKYSSCRSLRFATLSVVIAGGLALSSPAAAQVNAEQVLTIGRNVMSMEDYLLAIQYFNMAIKAKPYLADAYYLRGLAKLQLEDFEGAIADCSAAISRNKFKTEAYKARGFALQKTGRDSLAIDDYNIGLEYNPDDKYFLYYKGIAQTELKQYSQADSTFLRLLRRYPRFEEGLVARGRMNLLSGDTIAAMKDLDKALTLSRTNPGVYLMKAEMLTKRSQWEDAALAMDEAIRLLPEEIDLYINRAYIRYNLHNFYGAMADYDYALTLQPLNETALFNRALLRTEVKALSAAAEDLTTLLKINPQNFYAIYNRALIYLEIKDYRKAYNDFQEISRRYPKFYPAYYGMAECQQQMGNIREMLANIKKADQMVANYVDNPKKNPLDRPTIQAGKSRTANGKDNSGKSEEEEFMEKFNQLVTSEASETPELAFNEKIKGRVQDRDINITPQELFALSFSTPEISLRNLSNSFRNLEMLNRRQYISRKIYLNEGLSTPSDRDLLGKIFAIEDEFTSAISAADTPRPVDFFARGVARTMLKNFDGAISDLTRAIETSDDFIAALFARSVAYTYKGSQESLSSDNSHIQSPIIHNSLKGTQNSPVDHSAMQKNLDYQLAMNDIDTILGIDPSMLYAWYNKGYIYYTLGDFTSSILAYGKALEIDPEFGQGYFNRGLAYLRQGNRQSAFADLSKAGELGVLQAYNILKRLQ